MEIRVQGRYEERLDPPYPPIVRAGLDAIGPRFVFPVALEFKEEEEDRELGKDPVYECDPAPFREDSHRRDPGDKDQDADFFPRSRSNRPGFPPFRPEVALITPKEANGVDAGEIEQGEFNPRPER